MRFVYLFLILVPLLLPAQSAHRGFDLPTAKGWQELTISDGLSQGMIFDVKQDKQGFIWIATKDGLNRYDGHNFKVYAHDPYNPYSISENACSVLLLDHHDRLWIGTQTNGLNLFDRRAQRFYHVSISDRTTAGGGNYEIRTMSEDPEGNIWVSTDKNQLFKLTVPNTSNYPNTPNLTSQVPIRQISIPGHEIGIHNIQFNADGQAILGTTDGMSTINWRNPGQITPINRIKYQGADVNYQGADVGSMGDDALPGYWFTATKEGIFGWKNGVVKTRWFTSTNTNNVKLKCLDAHTIAIATVDHLWVMSPEAFFQGDSLTAATAYATMPPDLYWIRALLKDQMGTIWVGTSGYGLRLFNAKVKLFQTYLPKRSLSYLYQDRQGRTYVRQSYAYDLMDRATNQLTPLDKEIATNGDLQRFLMQDHLHQFWITYSESKTERYLLKKYATDWKRLKDYAIPAGIVFGDFGNQTIEDKNGLLWLGAGNGKLVCFDPVKETFQVFSYAHLLPQKGATVETYALYFDRAQTLWIGTQKGLIRATNLTTRPVFTLFKNSATDRESLSNDFVSCVADDPYQPDRYLWVSTKGGGLERLDKQTSRFKHFTEAQGLPNKVVYGILTDSFRNLWVSTNRGLGQFDPKTFRFRNYARADGLQDDEFNTGSFFKTASGELLFGGINGLTAFRPEEFMKSNAMLPKAHIIGLKVNNKAVEVGGDDGLLTTNIEETQEIDLDHTQNLLSFEFGVTDYTNSINNRYRYKLNGIDENWIEVGGTHVANYTQLPIGTYTLEMMGSANGNVWSRPVTLLVRIHPPFYRTWWAYLLYAVILVVVGWQLYLFQRQRLLLHQQLAFEQKEASRLVELDALKTQFFTNISHEFRTPLTLIVGPIEQMAREYAQDVRFPVLQQNANRLLRLINQLLDLSKLEAGQLKPEYEPGNFALFLRILASSFTSLAESRQIHFSFTQRETSYWAAFDRDKVEKIVANLLSNAFKFTPIGKAVLMEVAYGDGVAFFTIRDTGIGIAADKLPRIFDRFYQWSGIGADGKVKRSYEGTGIGLSLVKELVQVLGGTVSVESTEGEGTSFRVALPITQLGQPVEDLIKVTTHPENFRPGPVASSASAGTSPRSLVPGAGQLEKADNLLLIIDDNADIRAYVRSIFETEYQILEAGDGQEGLEKATEQLPDIVICDLMMPRLNGFGFCRALKTQTATSHIPVVMLTAKATVEDRIEGFELGADEYLTKPFNQAEIIVRVRNLIRQRERLGQYFQERLGLAPKVVPLDSTIIAKENDFIQKVQAVIDQRLAESSFDVETLSEQLNLSQRQLVRKLKALTGQTGVEFIRNRRLEQAATMIQKRELTVSEVAYQVGFESLSYFTRSFQDKFGVLPSAYAEGQE